jgi:tRNA G10  N-methylase Trm11
MQYFFIIGKNPTLSAAEIFGLFGRDGIQFSIITLATESLIIETEKELDGSYLMKQLGGIIKFGVIHANNYSNPSTSSGQVMFELHSPDLISSFLEDTGKKTFFGFSLYKLDQKVDLSMAKIKIKELGLEIKKELKKNGWPSRFVMAQQGLALSSVVVEKNKLLTQGAEMVIFIDKNKIYLGKTLAVQEFEEYSFRDYSRPGRDILSGLMPPKLAKIKINLAKINFNQILLDPFCGSGTILGEAGLMGYKNLIGSDISEKAIEDTRKNLEWLGNNFRFKIEDLRLINKDVKDLFGIIEKDSIDAIVTEPYLGPPLKPSAGPEEIKKIIYELGKLYLDAFRVFKNLLKPNSRLVIIFPIFRPGGKEQLFYLPILEEIKNLGFKTVSPIPKELENHPVIKVTERNSIIYSRPDQRVLREIFIWEKI